MISVKKLLYKVVGRVGELREMPAVSMQKSASITAGNAGTVTIDFPSEYSGGLYRCLAINTLSLSGTNSDYLVISGFTISNTNKTISIKVRSLASSSTINYTVNVYALFVKQ